MKKKSIEERRAAVEKKLSKIGITRTTKEKRLKDPLYSEVIRPLNQRESNK